MKRKSLKLELSDQKDECQNAILGKTNLVNIKILILVTSGVQNTVTNQIVRIRFSNENSILSR